MPTFEYGKSLKTLSLLVVAFFLVPILQLMNVIPKLASILFSTAVIVLLAFTAWTLVRTAIFHLLFKLKSAYRKSKKSSAVETEKVQSDKKSGIKYDDDDNDETDHYYFSGEGEEETHS